MEGHLTDVLNETQDVLLAKQSSYKISVISDEFFKMSCISDTSSSPPVHSLGQRQMEEVNMGVTHLQGNPSQELCTCSHSKQSTVWLPALLQTWERNGAFPTFWLVIVRYDHATCTGCVSPMHRESPCGP